MARDFRFSTNVFGVSSRKALQDRCRRLESAGFHTLFAADHLGAPAPFPVLVAAADATENLRVGTLVLNTPFWNPGLLAREIVTTDVLTGGRLDVGLGSGHMKWEFDTALTIAARHADVIGVAGVYQLPGEPPGTFRIGTAAEADERVRFAREQAGERAADVEWNVLVQAVVPTPDRRAAAEDLVARYPDQMSADEALETPYLLIGTAEQMAEQLRERRERYGFTSVTVHEPYQEAFEPVVELLHS